MLAIYLFVKMFAWTLKAMAYVGLGILLATVWALTQLSKLIAAGINWLADHDQHQETT